MCALIGRSSYVCGKDAEVPHSVSNQPDEAGSEHGAGCEDEFLAEGFNGGEASFELLLQIFGHFDGCGRQTFEEEVVVVCHGGVVEVGGVVGVAGVFQEDIFGCFVCVVGACMDMLVNVQPQCDLDSNIQEGK